MHKLVTKADAQSSTGSINPWIDTWAPAAPLPDAPAPEPSWSAVKAWWTGEATRPYPSLRPHMNAAAKTVAARILASKPPSEFTGRGQRKFIKDMEDALERSRRGTDAPDLDRPAARAGGRAYPRGPRCRAPALARRGLPGHLLAAAAQLGAGGCSVGAALVAVATPRGRLHALWSWSLTEDDAFAHQTTELTCLADASVDEAFVAVDQRGSAAVLARRAEAWSFVDASRPDVAGPAPALASPLQLSFLRGRTPVVVYAEPEQGLFLRPLVDLPPFVPPT
ncbi:hypothetical protein WMF28_41450 [Sorangium sp. So ce590]|uniref:hypothetical protein n=1 Tax=Sorangium sp. So ce590 TaxID=3133317 RepID=UPI003F626ACB